jgi:hypothetical protein
MTAATVNGRAVVSVEPVSSPLSAAGPPIAFRRVVKLVLDDGATAYGCTECDYTTDAMGRVRGHLKVHSDKPRKVRASNNGRVDVPLGATLGDLIGAHRRAEALMAVVERQANELADWRARAKDAEKRLTTFRKALGVN